MDLYPKFIIEDGCLIISKVTYHKEMVNDKEKVKGGGWFRLSVLNNKITFYGDSTDFGKAKFEDVKECVENGKVYTNQYHTHCIANDYTFAYDTQTEVINLEVKKVLN